MHTLWGTGCLQFLRISKNFAHVICERFLRPRKNFYGWIIYILWTWIGLHVLAESNVCCSPKESSESSIIVEYSQLKFDSVENNSVRKCKIIYKLTSIIHYNIIFLQQEAQAGVRTPTKPRIWQKIKKRTTTQPLHTSNTGTSLNVLSVLRVSK